MSRAGDYRVLVDFEEDQGTLTAPSGQHIVRFVSYAPAVWCHVEPLSGRQLIAAQQLVTTVTHRVTTRYNPSLALHPRLRIKIGPRVLLISHVLNVDERSREWEMLCTEVQ